MKSELKSRNKYNISSKTTNYSTNNLLSGKKSRNSKFNDQKASPPKIMINSEEQPISAILENNEKIHANYLAPKIILNENNMNLSNIQKVIEESKERENRINERLLALKNRVKLAIEPVYEQKSKIYSKTPMYDKNQLDTFNDMMNNILQTTKETQEEIKKTKDIVSNIRDETQLKMSGIFSSIVMEDCSDNHKSYGEPISTIGPCEDESRSSIGLLLKIYRIYIDNRGAIRRN